MAAGLGTSLRAVGAHAGFGALILECTFAAPVGGTAPVPAGMAVVEASSACHRCGAGAPWWLRRHGSL